MAIDKAICDELSEFKEFAMANPGLTLAEFAWMQLSLDVLLGTVEILCPAFLQHKGGIFFAAGFSEDRFNDWYQQLEGNIYEIENVMNHKHVRGIFRFNENHSFKIIEYVAELIKKFWLVSVFQHFPLEKISVKIIKNIEESDCIVTVYHDK